MSKPIDKKYLITSLKNFDKEILNKKYANGIFYEPQIGAVTIADKIEDTNVKLTTDNENKKLIFDFAIPCGRSIQSIYKDENNNMIVSFTDETYQNIGKLNVNVQADFLTSDGFGNLRYYNGHFQYYDDTTSTWIDTSISPENVYIMNMMPQAMKMMVGIYDVSLGRNKLKFEEPDDTIIDGQAACVVDKVIIRRKSGSAPTDEVDGILVAEILRKDFGLYKNNYFIDETFAPAIGETWHYKAFPLSTTGFYNTSSENEVSVFCKDYYLYGFTIDQSESDPVSMITYIEDNKDFASAYMDYTTDTFNYGDWAESFFMQVKPCMLKYDGTVDYYLNPDHYDLKADGTASDVSNASYEGNAMIQFPKTYWKIVDNGNNTANVYICSKQLDDNFHCWSHIDNNGSEIDYCFMPIYNGYNDGTRLRSLSGKTPMNTQTTTTEINLAKANNQTSDIIWYTEVYSDRVLVNLLLLLIGKSTDTQTVFGNGYCTGGSEKSNPRITTGTMNAKGLFWGHNGSSMVGLKVFGMEHWWGNQWRRIAGWINDKGTQKVKMTYGQSDGSTTDGYNTTGNGYLTITNATPSGTSGGYISGVIFNEYGIIPKIASGSATTYYTDGLWLSNAQVDYALVGGRSNVGLLAGALCSALNSIPLDASWSYAATISCKPLAAI